MQLSEVVIKEFEEIYKLQNPGREIDRESLISMAHRIIHSVELLYNLN